MTSKMEPWMEEKTHFIDLSIIIYFQALYVNFNDPCIRQIFCAASKLQMSL